MIAGCSALGHRRKAENVRIECGAWQLTHLCFTSRQLIPMLRSLLPKSVSDGAENGSFWRSLGAAISIFVAILASLMLLAETPLTQAWIVGLLGLTVLLPHALWLAAVLHYDGWTPRPWPLVMLAVAWGSLISSTAAIFLETVSAPIANRLGVSDLNTMIMAPLWEEVTKGAFIVLLFV